MHHGVADTGLPSACADCNFPYVPSEIPRPLICLTEHANVSSVMLNLVAYPTADLESC